MHALAAPAALMTVLVLACAPLPSLAQSPPPGQAPTPAARLAKSMGDVCPKMVLELVGRPEMKPVLSARPVDALAVCACTERSFLADQRMQAFVNVDEQTLKARIGSEQFKSYMIVRLFNSVFGCLAPALDASLAAMPLTP